MEQSSKVKNIETLQTLKEKQPHNSPYKTIHIMFYKSPTKIITKQNKVTAIELETTQLIGEAGSQKAKGTETYEELPCDIIF